MKIIFLIFTVISSTTATITDQNCPAEFQPIIPNIEDTVSALVHYLTILIKILPDIIEEILTDLTDSVVNIEQSTSYTYVPLPFLIEMEGYPVQSHYVTTSDGYILNLFRIPFGKTGNNLNKVVLIVHGQNAAATDWVIFGPNHGLAYFLANKGFDVWLGNCRGNRYSANHTTLNTTSREFWNFSWHEIGTIDVPTMIDYILGVTNKTQLYHVGHSQGTTTFFVMTSMRPEYNTKIAHHISMAPAVYENHLFVPLLRILSLTIPLGAGNILEYLRPGRSTPSNIWKTITAFCSGNIERVLCKYLVQFVAGFSVKQVNASSIPLLALYYPAGGSSKQTVHYGQEVMSSRFSQYDYGLIENKLRYKCLFSPDYNLSMVTAPITLMVSANDWFSSQLDVKRLSKKLANLKEIYELPFLFSHLDYVIGNSAPQLIYPKVASVFLQN